MYDSLIVCIEFEVCPNLKVSQRIHEKMYQEE